VIFQQAKRRRRLLKLFRSIKRRAEAKNLAEQIALAINAGSGRFFLQDDKQQFYNAVLEDEFVLSYLYGTILFSIEIIGVHEEETVGYITWEVFERLFPGHGKGALGVCNIRVEERSENFTSGIKAGYGEMKGIWDSPGEGLLQSLNDYLSDFHEQMS
jgi:hypothetical protein